MLLEDMKIFGCEVECSAAAHTYSVMQLDSHRAHRIYPSLRILQHILLSTLDVPF